MRLPWRRKPKPIKICAWCPLEVERRIANVESGPELYDFASGPVAPAERIDRRPEIVAEMRRIFTAEFPRPCERCPRAVPAKTALGPTMCP